MLARGRADSMHMRAVPTWGEFSHSLQQGGWNAVHRRKSPGAPVRFQPRHSEKLCEIISSSPWKWRYESDLWTVRMARDTLEEETGDRFSQTRVLSEMHSLGFSFQKPQVAALEKKTRKSPSGRKQCSPTSADKQVLAEQ